MSRSGSTPPSAGRPIARCSAANIHHTGRRSATGATTGRGRLQPASQRGGLGERDVGPFELAGRGQHVRGERGERVLRDVDDREHVERVPARRARRAGCGNAVSGLPPVTKSARMLPASISSTSATAGTWPSTRGSSGRLAGAGVGRPRPDAVAAAESVDDAAVELHAAGRGRASRWR